MATIPTAAVEAASRRTDSIAWSPAPILVPKGLIEVYAIAYFRSAIVAATSHAAGNRRRHNYHQSEHRATVH
jgi:hypothetical protein